MSEGDRMSVCGRTWQIRVCPDCGEQRQSYPCPGCRSGRSGEWVEVAPVARVVGPSLTVYVRDDGSTVHAALSHFEGAEKVGYVPAREVVELRESRDRWRQGYEALEQRVASESQDG